MGVFFFGGGLDFDDLMFIYSFVVSFVFWEGVFCEECLSRREILKETSESTKKIMSC